MMDTLHTKEYGLLIGGTIVPICWTYYAYQSAGAWAAIVILLAGIVLNAWCAIYIGRYEDWNLQFWSGAIAIVVLTAASIYLLGFITVLEIYLTIAGGAAITGFILAPATVEAYRAAKTRRILRKRYGL